ncbi:hypothetical protein J1605_015512, partial [Eschrichtius robustus]
GRAADARHGAEVPPGRRLLTRYPCSSAFPLWWRGPPPGPPGARAPIFVQVPSWPRTGEGSL